MRAIERLPITILISITIGLALLGSAYAQLSADNPISEVDKHFETVRGQLVGFYSSEIVSHAAVILGLLVAIPTTIAELPKLYKSLFPRKHGKFLSCLSITFVVLLLSTLTTYAGARIVYWSNLNAYLLFSNRQLVETELNANMTTMEPTSYMGVILNYTTQSTKGWNLGNMMHPDNVANILWVYAVLNVAATAISYYLVRKMGLKASDDQSRPKVMQAKDSPAQNPD